MDAYGRTLWPARYIGTTPAWLEPFREDFRADVRAEVEIDERISFARFMLNNTTAADAARREA